jgi:hypothetical protein
MWYEITIIDWCVRNRGSCPDFFMPAREVANFVKRTHRSANGRALQIIVVYNAGAALVAG